jgi:uncharacterized protein YkwD
VKYYFSNYTISAANKYNPPMISNTKHIKAFHLTAWAFAFSLALTACGGGGSATPTATPSPAGTPSASTEPAASGTPTPAGGSAATPAAPEQAATTPGPVATAPPPAPATPTPPTATPTAAAVECPIGDYKSAVAAQVNAFRSAPQVCGGAPSAAAGALGYNGQLDSASTRHSTDMAGNNYWGPDPHTGTDGSTIRQRVPAAGYNYTTVGENVAAGQSSASEVVNDWIGSPGHCKNMMTAAYVDIGVSCKFNPNSTYKYYWTLVMGKR